MRFATWTESNALFVPTVTVDALLGCVVVLLALIAFGRLMPTAPDVGRPEPRRGRV